MDLKGRQSELEFQFRVTLVRSPLSYLFRKSVETNLQFMGCVGDPLNLVSLFTYFSEKILKRPKGIIENISSKENDGLFEKILQNKYNFNLTIMTKNCY